MQMGINFAMKPSLKRGHIDIAALFAGYPGRVGCYYGTKSGPSYTDILARNREALGPERVTNGDFSSGLVGWVDASTAPAFASASLGVGTLTSNGNTGRLRQAISTTPGAWCRLQFRVVKSNAVARLSIGTTAGGTDIRVATAMTDGVNCVDFVSTTSTTWINWYSSADFSIDDVSAREIADWSKLVLFDDANGTVPVFSVFQSSRGRGLLLDASQGLVRGPELITNGDFSAGSSNWSVVNTDATHTITFSAAGARFVSDTTTPQLLLRQSGTLTVGKFYEITVKLGSLVSGAIKTDSFGAQIALPSAAGTYIFKGIASTANFELTRSTTNVDATIASVSVRELPGNHMVQPTAAARGELSARYNLLTATEDFTNGSLWTKSAGGTGSAPVVTAAAGLSPRGDMTASRVQLTKGAGTTTSDISSLMGNAGNALPTNSMQHKLSVWLKSCTGASFAVQIILAGAEQTVTVTGQWQEFSVSGSSAVDSSCVVARLRGTYGTSDSADLLVWGADLRLAADAIPSLPAYQRVTSPTDYDDVGFPVYWRAQTDDWAKTRINPSGDTKALVMWAGQSFYDSSEVVIVEMSAAPASSLGVVGLSCGGGSGTEAFTFRSRGSSSAFSLRPKPYPAGRRSALTCSGAIDTDVSTLRIAGVGEYASSADQGTGSYTEQDVFFGARGGTSLFANIREYAPPLILFQPTSDAGLSASQIAALDKAYAKAVGVTL